MRFIKRKRDQRNYEIVQFMTRPPKLFIPEEKNYVDAPAWDDSRLMAILASEWDES